MPRVSIFCILPALRGHLVPGVYGDPANNGLRIEDGHAHATRVAREFAIGSTDDDRTERRRYAEGRRLLGDLNRLIRWFRVVGRRPGIPEISLAQAGTIDFEMENGQPWGRIRVTEDQVSSSRSPANIAQEVQQRFTGGAEPAVEDLFILDAQEAVRQGRFREAVLFCWSVIDGAFNRKFRALVDKALADEWSESRKFLLSNDFGLRHKMGLGLRLVCGHSMYHEGDEFWTRLSRSYDHRNRIIHEGAVVTEQDALLSLWVAQRVVQIVQQIPGA